MEHETPKKRRKTGKKSLSGLRRFLRQVYLFCQRAKAGIQKAWEATALFFMGLWEVIGPVCKRIYKAMVPVFKRIGRALQTLFGPLAKKLQTRLSGLGKFARIGVGAVSLSLVVLLLAVIVSARTSESTTTLAEASPGHEDTLPVGEATPELTPTPMATATPVPEPMQEQVLQKGDDSPTVALVQTRLMELGYMDSDEPTEHFGSITEAALIRFQKHNGLSPNGLLGEGTWLLLMNEGTGPYIMQEGDEGDDVQDVQTRLYELGYLSKSFITGTFGEKTQAAVMDFQKANGISSDGMVGHETLDVLYADEVVGNFFTKGESNDTIAAYQQRLKDLGYLSSSYSIKGKMDDTTVKAIRKFQENNDLTPDGYLGPGNMAALDSRSAKIYTLTLGMSGSEVKAVQKRLKALGYLTSNSQVTGYYGDATEDAVEKFQRRNGLSVDGTVGIKTLEKLNSSSAKKAKATATPKPTPKKTAKPTAKTTKSSGKTTAKATSKTTKKATATPKPVDTSTKKGVEKLIAIAESKLGSPYVGGAKGPNRFDCSGFVYWCMKQAGFSGGYMTSRTWRTCTKYTRIESFSSIKRGDVLVFKGDSMATGHVGIYLGSGKMIDASSSAGKVRITTTVTSGSYWKNHFLMAYRIYD